MVCIRVDILTETEVNNIHAYLHNNDKPMDLIWIIGISTGLRISDILKLKYKQLLQKTVRITEQKTRKKRRVYIRQYIRATARIYADMHIINYDIAFKKYNRKYVYRHFKKAALKCGINKNIGTHSMRKSYAANYITHNSIYELQSRLNHNIISDTINYTLPNDFFMKNRTKKRKSTKKNTKKTTKKE